MTMTKKDFEEMAGVVRSGYFMNERMLDMGEIDLPTKVQRDIAVMHTERMMAGRFRQANPRFDEVKFRAACKFTRES